MRLAPLVIALLTSLSVTASSFAQEPFEARVVGVSDGDTITVLHDERPLKLRLEGIDCPESGQAFGQVAKRFTSGLVFGKAVVVRPRTTDRYGRMVADVSIQGSDVGLALVQAGLAWHFLRYSSDSKLAAAERVARAARRGLWADPSPVAPWEYRHPAVVNASAGPIVFHGNAQSHVYHGPACQYYRCKNCTIEFQTAEAALADGYRPHAECTGSRE